MNIISNEYVDQKIIQNIKLMLNKEVEKVIL